MAMTKGQSKESKMAHSQKKGREFRAKLSKMLAIREKKQTQKTRGVPKTTIKSKRLEINKFATKTM